MLSSTIPCPRCGAESVVTILAPNGPDLGRAEVFFECREGHDVPPSDVLAVWDANRGARTSSR